MARQVGPVHIEGLHNGAINIPSITGYVSPNMQSLRIAHDADSERIKGQSGKTTSVMLNDEVLACDFEFIPEGANSIAGAIKSASIPRAGAFLQISGLNIVQMGPFTDALNTDGVNTQPWIYMGGGTLNPVADGKWTATLPCMRFPLIPANATITDTDF